MASPKTIILKRNAMLARILTVEDVTPPSHGGPNRAERRRQLQNWCRASGVPYSEARADIRKEEAKMRAAGIDPWAPKKHLMTTPTGPAVLNQADSEEILKEAKDKGVEVPDELAPENL